MNICTKSHTKNGIIKLSIVKGDVNVRLQMARRRCGFSGSSTDLCNGSLLKCRSRFGDQAARSNGNRRSNNRNSEDIFTKISGKNLRIAARNDLKKYQKNTLNFSQKRGAL